MALVVQRPDNFIRWIRHYTRSKIYFTLNVVQGFCTLSNLTVAGVCQELSAPECAYSIVQEEILKFCTD